MRAQFRSAAMALGLSAAIGSCALGQPGGKPPEAVPEKGPESKPVPMKAIEHPGLRLGARVNLIERQYSIVPTVVIVPDEASFLAALRGWRTYDQAVRYPILIDDKTWAGRMRIARFVRAFKPKSVVRWKAVGGEANLPPDVTERQGQAEAVAAGVWGATSAASLKKAWDERGFVPPGVVVCSFKDPAWTAGVALAAFHGEPLLWVDPPECPDPTGYLMLEQGDDYNARIMKALDATGWKWNKMGDDIDSVTVCATTPSRVWLGPRDQHAAKLGWTSNVPARTERKFLSLTDVIGRLPKAPPKPVPGEPEVDAPPNPPPARWAWCGQIMGTSARAAADAMCAVFLQPDRAWLFDGYEANGRWNEFDMTRASGVLEKNGIASMLDDSPSGKGATEFRARAAGQRPGAAETGMGVDAGLIAINTKGNADFFDLSPGQCKPLDVPILRKPAMVYLVHSFSAMAPTSRQTVGGVWMERGAYAYLGSVEEPYLQAFVPTPDAMARMMAGMPWGAAVRLDGFEPWKLAVFGDPLITFGPQGARNEAISLPLEGIEDVGSMLPGQLHAKDYLGALWTLVLSGRDKDASRLLSAVARDPKQMSTEMALAGISSAFLVGDYQTFMAAADRVGPALQDVPRVRRDGIGEIRDMVWHAVWARSGTATRAETDLLAGMVRPENEARDVDELRKMIERNPPR